MHVAAFRCEPVALGHAETMLFVDDREVEPVEPHVVREERVGSEYDVDLTGREALGDLSSLARANRAGQERAAYSELFEERRETVRVLGCEDFGRRHERHLPARLEGDHCSERRNRGLARTDVSLEQAPHGTRLRQIGSDLGCDALLGSGERVRKTCDERRKLVVRDSSRPRATAHAAAASEDLCLQGENRL